MKVRRCAGILPYIQKKGGDCDADTAWRYRNVGGFEYGSKHCCRIDGPASLPSYQVAPSSTMA